METAAASAFLSLTNKKKKPYRNHIDEGGLAGILEPNQGQLHLLLPEERLEPVEQFVDERYHRCRLNAKG